MTDSESAAAAAMDAHSTNPSGMRDDLVERLKKELNESTERAAQFQQRASMYEERERGRVGAWQPEAQYFLKEFIKEEIDNYHSGTTLQADVEPLAVWSDEYTKKSDIGSQSALAAMSYVASKGVKRLREEASRLAPLEESLANALKENEELKQTKEKVMRDYDEAISLSNERQKGLMILQEKLAEAGMYNQKFDFSNLASREAGANNASTTAMAAGSPSSVVGTASATGVANPLEPHTAASSVSMASTPLETVKACASRAAGNRVGNPLEKSNDLLSELLSKSTAGLRVTASGTSHPFVGNVDSSNSLMASLRAAGY